MIDGLTTGACADRLNFIVGMRVFSADFILGQVDDGLLHARVDLPGSDGRKRFVRIHPDDLRVYVVKHHRPWIAAYDARHQADAGNTAQAS